MLKVQKQKRSGVDSVCSLSALYVFCSNRVSHVPSGVIHFIFLIAGYAVRSDIFYDEY